MDFLSRLFSSKSNDTDLGIILENDGIIPESTSSYKPTQYKTKTTHLLNNKLDTANSSINNDTYRPPTTYYNLPKKVESPFSPFKIWGQKT